MLLLRCDCYNRKLSQNNNDESSSDETLAGNVMQTSKAIATFHEFDDSMDSGYNLK